MSSAYVELHSHSCFSLLDGAATPEALLDRAAELGMGALGLTDHHGLYAAIRFNVAAQERGLHPVIGAELTLEDERHLVLLVETQQGYRNLCWLLSRAQLEHEKGAARLAWAHLPHHAQGLIALTGCRQGVLAAPLLAGNRDEARRQLSKLRTLFGAEHLYIELQHHLRPDDDALVADLASLAREAGLPLVATNNVHYARRKDYRLQQVLTAINHNAALRDCRNQLYPNSELFLKTGAELAALLNAYPEALAHTIEIATRCNVNLDMRALAIPPTQGNEDGNQIGRASCRERV